MSKAIHGLRLFQSGLEVTKGTAVAATSKMAVNDIKFTPIDANFRPALAKGLITSVPGNETVVVRGTKISIPDSPVIYDQHHIPLAMSIKGGVAPSGGNPYTWTFPRDPLADPAINARTLERRITDGANPIDNEWAYAFFSQIAWHWKPDQPLMWSAEGFARRVQASTLTGSLAFPTIEIAAAALGQVWIDATWANLGTTLIAAQVLSADIVFKTGYKPKMAFDGRSDLDFSTYVIDAKEVAVDVTMRMLIEASAGQYATEKTAAEAATLRAMRLKVTGTGSRALTLDMLLKHTDASLTEIGEDDGSSIVEMKLKNSTDGTNLFAATLVNTVNTTT